VSLTDAGRAPVGAARFSSALRRAELEPRLLGMAVALGLVWAAFDLASGGLFLSPRNLYNLAVQSSVVGVMACGMVFVITARHIDLSVGSVLGLTGMLVAVLQAELLPVDAVWGWPLACGVGLALGAVIGMWQGWWVAYRGVPAFVVTLAGLLIFRGAAYLVTDGRTVAPLASGFQVLGGGLSGSIGAAASWGLAILVSLSALLSVGLARRSRERHAFATRPLWADGLRLACWLGGALGVVLVMNAYTHPRTGVARGVPVPVLIWMAIVFATSLLFRRTRFGRHVVAIGGNPRAARRAGIDTRRVTLGVFAAMGLLAALSAILTTARLGAGANSMGTLAELSVIAAAVIGGTSLAGGRGSVVGAALGALLMQSLENGMLLLGSSSALRQVAIGAVLLGAVFLDGALRRRAGA
jgi:D-xylose transport system permease protein